MKKTAAFAVAFAVGLILVSAAQAQNCTVNGKTSDGITVNANYGDITSPGYGIPPIAGGTLTSGDKTYSATIGQLNTLMLKSLSKVNFTAGGNGTNGLLALVGALVPITGDQIHGEVYEINGDSPTTTVGFQGTLTCR